MYQAWKNSCTGDSTDKRYARILRWGGYTGPSSIQTGLTTSMGPAVTDGQDVVSALGAVVETEMGQHFVAKDGTVTFQARSARYNTTVPAYVFGEQWASGEIPYEDGKLDFDPTRLGNQMTVTQAATNQQFAAQDAQSISDFFPRTMERTVNSASALECQDAANYLLSRYKRPAMRVPLLKLHPSANPGLLWPVCLAMELGTRIRSPSVRPAPRPPLSTASSSRCSGLWTTATRRG